MKKRYIFFRSRKIHSTTNGGVSLRMHGGRGSDFSDIGPYIVGDDTRDISWKHSLRTDTIQKKIHIEEDTFPIYILQTIDISQGFYTENNQKSVYEYAIELQDVLEISAKKYNYKAQESSLYSLKNKKNSMIYYITSSLNGGDFEIMRGLAKYNDLIVLHIFHPDELLPTNNILYGGLGVNIDAYIQEFEFKQKNIKKITQNIDAGYLLLTTNMDIVSSMLQFFKKRFSK